MSGPYEDADKALWSKLNGDASLTALATGGIYARRAPHDLPETDGIVSPYLVMLLSVSEDRWTLGGGPRIIRFEVTFNAVEQGLSNEICRQMLDRLDVVLHDAALSGLTGTLLYMRRLNRSEDAVEEGESGVTWQLGRVAYRIEVQV